MRTARAQVISRINVPFIGLNGGDNGAVIGSQWGSGWMHGGSLSPTGSPPESVSIPSDSSLGLLHFRTETNRSGSAERGRVSPASKQPNNRINFAGRVRLSGTSSPQTVRIILIELIFNTQRLARPPRVTSRAIRGAALEVGLFKTSVILRRAVHAKRTDRSA